MLPPTWSGCGRSAGMPDEEDDDGWPRELGRKPRATITRSRGDRVSLAWAEPRESVGVATSTLQTAEFLLQQKDPPLMRRWLSQHSAAERKAILQHLEQRKKRGGGNG